MKVYAHRSGRTLHASKACPQLASGRVLELDRSDALAGAKVCRESRCQAAFAKETGR